MPHRKHGLSKVAFKEKASSAINTRSRRAFDESALVNDELVNIDALLICPLVPKAIIGVNYCHQDNAIRTFVVKKIITFARWIQRFLTR